jgi:hypothetical protein
MVVFRFRYDGYFYLLLQNEYHEEDELYHGHETHHHVFLEKLQYQHVHHIYVQALADTVAVAHRTVTTA